MDRVHIRSRQTLLSETRVRAYAFQIGRVRSRVNSAEGKRGLSGSRWTHDDSAPLKWNVHIDVPQIVRPRSAAPGWDLRTSHARYTRSNNSNGAAASTSLIVHRSGGEYRPPFANICATVCSLTWFGKSTM